MPVVTSMAGPISLQVRQWSHWHTAQARPEQRSQCLAKHPHAEKDKNQRPEAIDSEFKDVHGVQQEKNAQSR